MVNASIDLLIWGCNNPKKIKNKSSKSVNRFFKSMTSEERTHWYVNTYSQIAINEMKKFGIPASITMAQGILESSSGNGGLALKSNNHFGIKCHTGWKGKKVYHDDDARGECFRNIKIQKNHIVIIQFF